MFGIGKLLLIFVGLCTVIGCKAQHDDFCKISSDVRSDDSEIAETVSPHEKYMPPTSEPEVPEEHIKPSEDRAEDENNTFEEMLHEHTVMKDEISDEALSHEIEMMSRTHMERNAIVTIGCVYTLCWLLNHRRRNFRGTLIFISLFILTVTFIVTWWEVSLKVNIEPPPTQCDSTITRSMDPECRRYYDEKMNSVPFKDVPTIVFLLTLQRIISMVDKFITKLLIFLSDCLPIVDHLYPWFALFCGLAIFFVYMRYKYGMNENVEQLRYRRRYIRR